VRDSPRSSKIMQSPLGRRSPRRHGRNSSCAMAILAMLGRGQDARRTKSPRVTKSLGISGVDAGVVCLRLRPFPSPRWAMVKATKNPRLPPAASATPLPPTKKPHGRAGVGHSGGKAVIWPVETRADPDIPEPRIWGVCMIAGRRTVLSSYDSAAQQS
jgi:hypothetical protein